MTAEGAPPRTPVLEILDPGLLLTIQDRGRPGRASEGVTPGGSADDWSLRVANALVGNAPGAAAIEATLLGPTVRALAPVTVAIAGTMTGRVVRSGEPVPPGSSVTLAAGEELALETAVGGARGYLAIPGGIDVPEVLGSRSTALGAGFGGLEGRALRAGDRLGAGPAATHVIPRARWPGPASPTRVTSTSPLRVLAGPHAAAFGADALRALVDGPWTIAPASDRVGLRLTGHRLPGLATGELASHGVLAGTVQVPPDGMPIVLLVDHQPTGGYPVVAVVITADLDRLGQLAPGAPVAFGLVSSREARAALAAADAAFADAHAHLREAAGWDELWRGAGS